MGGRDRNFWLLSTSRLSCRFVLRCRNSSETSYCNAKRVSSSVDSVNRVVSFDHDEYYAHSASRILPMTCFCLWLDDWRLKVLSCKEPDIRAILQNVSTRFEAIDFETQSCAMWARGRIRGESIIIRRKLSMDDAARCIQGMYRTRKARQYLRTLAQAIYRRAVDPHTGLPYFYNTRTGATSWSLPTFLS